MSADRRIAPSLAKRTGNRFTVQVSRDRPRAPSGRELTEDAAHDQRFGLVDRALPAERLALAIGPLDDIIAVAESSARLAFLDTPLETAMGLGGEVLPEQRVHRALPADMQLGDFSLG